MPTQKLPPEYELQHALSPLDELLRSIARSLGEIDERNNRAMDRHVKWMEVLARKDAHEAIGRSNTYEHVLPPRAIETLGTIITNRIEWVGMARKALAHGGGRPLDQALTPRTRRASTELGAKLCEADRILRNVLFALPMAGVSLAEAQKLLPLADYFGATRDRLQAILETAGAVNAPKPQARGRSRRVLVQWADTMAALRGLTRDRPAQAGSAGARLARHIDTLVEAQRSGCAASAAAGGAMPAAEWFTPGYGLWLFAHELIARDPQETMSLDDAWEIALAVLVLRDPDFDAATVSDDLSSLPPWDAPAEVTRQWTSRQAIVRDLENDHGRAGNGLSNHVAEDAPEGVKAHLMLLGELAFKRLSAELADRGRERAGRRKTTAKRRQHRLTDVERSAYDTVLKHNGNYSAAADELGRHPSSVREACLRAREKVKRMERTSRSVSARRRLPEDRRGQQDVSAPGELD